MSFQKLAEFYLLMRENGYSVRRVLWYSWRVYVILGAATVSALLALYFLDSPRVFWFMLGLVIAMPIRDVELQWRVKKSWPFWIEVVNWDKVEAIADGTCESSTLETR